MAGVVITGKGMPVVLGILIVAQLFCTAFFVSDLISDLREAGGIVPQGGHLTLEAFAALILGATVVVEGRYLSDLVRRKDRLENSLNLASAAVHDAIEMHFDHWSLTAAERDVATFLVKGFGTSEIAELRGSAEGTVKAHLHAIYRKSGTRNRAEVLSVLIESLMGNTADADSKESPSRA